MAEIAILSMVDKVYITCYCRLIMQTLAALLSEKSGPDREYFLRHLLHIDMAELYLHPHRPVPDHFIKKLHAFEHKHAAGWPVQYLLGEAWFFGRKFKVAPGVLIPRPETELLVERAIALTKNQPATIIDIGTGSGAIAVSLAKNTDAKIAAVDISAKALTIARANARAHTARVQFSKSNLLAALTWPRTPFVLIAANLPYLSDKRMKKLSAEVRREPKLALYGGPDGLDLYKKLFAQIRKFKRANQTIMILAEIDPEQKTKLAALTRRELPDSRIEFHHDLHHDVRLGEITF